MDNSRARAVNVQDELRTSHHTKKIYIYIYFLESCQKLSEQLLSKQE